MPEDSPQKPQYLFMPTTVGLSIFGFRPLLIPSSGADKSRQSLHHRTVYPGMFVTSLAGGHTGGQCSSMLPCWCWIYDDPPMIKPHNFDVLWKGRLLGRSNLQNNRHPSLDVVVSGVGGWGRPALSRSYSYIFPSFATKLFTLGFRKGRNQPCGLCRI